MSPNRKKNKYKRYKCTSLSMARRKKCFTYQSQFLFCVFAKIYHLDKELIIVVVSVKDQKKNSEIFFSGMIKSMEKNI